MKKAWIENGIVRDVANGDPVTLFHPDIAKHYDTDVPDGTLPGASFVGGQWRNPAQVAPVVPVAESVKVSPVEFKLLFTSAERVAIKAARTSDPIIDDFFDIVEDPRLTLVDLGLQSTKDAIDYLESKALITAERKTEILKGIVV